MRNAITGALLACAVLSGGRILNEDVKKVRATQPAQAKAAEH